MSADQVFYLPSTEVGIMLKENNESYRLKLHKVTCCANLYKVTCVAILYKVTSIQ